MASLNNTVDILRILPKTNCRACMEKTCLAFAATVFQGKRMLSECPHIPEEFREKEALVLKTKHAAHDDAEKTLAELKDAVRKTSLSDRANSLGGRFDRDRLTLKIMGKDFHIHQDGALASDIHVIPWVSIPILRYVVSGKGENPSGHWTPFRELPGGAEMAGLFGQRCEKPLKKLADRHPGLFEDMIMIFDGKTSDRFFDSDINLVLRPLPKVPILICYDKPEDGLESALHLFFDQSAPENLSIGGLYGLGAGLVNMFEKIASRHGF